MHKRQRSDSGPSTFSQMPATQPDVAAGVEGVGHGMHMTAGRRKQGKGKSKRAILLRIAALEKTEKNYIQLANNGGLVTMPANATGSNAVILLLNGMVRGTAVQTRVGDTVRLLKGHAKIAFRANFGGAVVKYAVILDTQSNNTTVTATNLWNTTTPGAITLWNSNNENFWQRFKILREKQILCNTSYNYYIAGVSTNCGYMGYDEISWNCNQFVANYAGGNAGTIADINAGALYIVFWGSTNGQFAAASTCQCDVSTIQYFDSM